jgi:hypothetical protein
MPRFRCESLVPSLFSVSTSPSQTNEAKIEINKPETKQTNQNQTEGKKRKEISMAMHKGTKRKQNETDC